MTDLGGLQGAPLASYQQYIRQVIQERGFDDESVSQKFMLLAEELGEFAHAARKQADMKPGADRSENLWDEAGDVLIVLLDICNRLGINLEQAFIQKEQKNQSRTWE